MSFRFRRHIFQLTLPRTALAACALFLLAGLTPALHAAPAKTSKTQKTAPAPKTAPATYKGAIVINAANGEILFQDNPDVLNPPASVTKLMTFLVVQDAIAAGQLALDTPVRVTREDSAVGGTQVWLDPRETFTVDELLHALLIQSANDAASALAHAAAGDRATFVARMNARARALGMTRTTFVTPHGLPPPSRRAADGDLTTPRDLATLARHLVNNTDILDYTSIIRRPFGQGTRPPGKVIQMENHNHLLGKVPGLDGLKTGYTASAGFCLAATAVRNGNRLIVVTMGSPDSKSRDLKIAELFDKTFARLPPGNAAPAHPVTSATAPTAPKRDPLNLNLNLNLNLDPRPSQPSQTPPGATTSPIAPATPAASAPPPPAAAKPAAAAPSSSSGDFPIVSYPGAVPN